MLRYYNFLYHSSSLTGLYNLTVGNSTWKARCQMNGVTGCGGGVWELVMLVKGHKVTFHPQRQETRDIV